MCYNVYMSGTGQYRATPTEVPLRAPDGLSTLEGMAPETAPKGGVAVPADKVSTWARIRSVEADLIDPAEVARTAQERVPTNVYGLPLGIYRSDLMAPSQVVRGQLLPEDLPTPPEPEPGYVSTRLSSRFIQHNGKPVLVLDERVLRQAYVELDYEEGYPQLPGGMAFWSRLPWEPHEAYIAFEAYLKMGQQGGRYTAGLAGDLQLQARILGAQASGYSDSPGGAMGAAPSVVAAEGQHRVGKEDSALAGARGSSEGKGRGPDGPETPHTGAPSLATIAPEYDNSARLMLVLKQWYQVFQWAYRAKAYDQFYIASLQRQRQMLALQLESEHYLVAERLAQKALIFMGVRQSEDGKVPEESLTEDGRNRFWAEATPKVILETLAMAVKLQRLSVGLQGAAPSNPVVINQTTNVQASGSAGALSAGASGASKTSSREGDNADVPELSDDERARRVASILDAARARAAGHALVGGQDPDVDAPEGAPV